MYLCLLYNSTVKQLTELLLDIRKTKSESVLYSVSETLIGVASDQESTPHMLKAVHVHMTT